MASPGNLSETQNLQPHLRLNESELAFSQHSQVNQEHVKVPEALISGVCRNVHQMAGLQQAQVSRATISPPKSPSNSALSGLRNLEPLLMICEGWGENPEEIPNQ